MTDGQPANASPAGIGPGAGIATGLAPGRLPGSAGGLAVKKEIKVPKV
jgi:hypothetical protein